MSKGPTRTPVSLFHTPAAASGRLFHTVLRAGHVRAAPDYGVDRQSHPGHDLLFCVAGAGFVRMEGKVFAVSAGELAWIDCRHPHAHWADPDQPWELLWLRLDGKPTQSFARALSVTGRPVFEPRDGADLAAIFSRIFALLHERPLALDAALHAAVTALIALLFEARQRNAAAAASGPAGDDRLRPVLTGLRLNSRQRWRIEDMARLSGMSVPHFFRRFRKATGASPMDWLRRERMNQAKRRLSESRDSIRAIAEAVGYGDPFYFSRDFKKLVGMSPRHYRQQETSRAQPVRALPGSMSSS